MEVEAARCRGSPPRPALCQQPKQYLQPSMESRSYQDPTSPTSAYNIISAEQNATAFLRGRLESQHALNPGVLHFAGPLAHSDQRARRAFWSSLAREAGAACHGTGPHIALAYAAGADQAKQGQAQLGSGSKPASPDTKNGRLMAARTNLTISRKSLRFSTACPACNLTSSSAKVAADTSKHEPPQQRPLHPETMSRRGVACQTLEKGPVQLKVSHTSQRQRLHH